MDSERTNDNTVTVLVAGDLNRSDALHAPVGNFEIVGRSVTGNDAINDVLTELPDVMLLDVRIEDVDPRAVCRRLREWAPATKIVAATPIDDERAYTTIVAGAAGAVSLQADHELLARTIREVARGEAVLLSRMAGRLLHDLDAWAQRSADPLYPPPSLTATEREVLTRLSKGDDPDTIAQAHAVTSHLVNLHAGFAVGKLHRYVHGSERIAAEGHTTGG